MLLPLSSLLLSTLLIHSTSAGHCRRIPPTPCGEVDNTSGRTLTYTTQLRKGPDLCDIPDYKYNVEIKPVPCKHEHLLDQGHIGGQDIDVDAFTFDDDDYWLDSYKTGLVMRRKGVWTLVGDLKQARCFANPQVRGHGEDMGKAPYCEVRTHLSFMFGGNK
ncbi:MAG: hypothetical protein M1816_005974 [Peltula sp. TS41687]|nr:MAG: hypothetical protein M1816_005974 [Peltula sp. TS41687]